MVRVVFKIKSSKRSNNGTDIGSGQIPEILYRLPEIEKENGVQIQLLEKEFSSTVSPVSALVHIHRNNINTVLKFNIGPIVH